MTETIHESNNTRRVRAAVNEVPELADDDIVRDEAGERVDTQSQQLLLQLETVTADISQDGETRGRSHTLDGSPDSGFAIQVLL